jgi:hypothetical protein
MVEKDSIDLWSAYKKVIEPLLGAEDDPALWQSVVNTVFPDAQALCQLVQGSWRVITQLGSCSHWLRPHQTRWTADGGFAWPTGYQGRPWSRLGLPEFDWFRERTWRPGLKQLLFRVAVPSRSRRHRQAAVHTVWHPGKAFGFRSDVIQFYGFRRQASGSWACVAYRPWPSRVEVLYERAKAEPS